jgi:hypothetical protein
MRKGAQYTTGHPFILLKQDPSQRFNTKEVATFVTKPTIQ